MANRRLRQFMFSATKNLVALQGRVSLVQEVKATLVTQGITLTAAAFGTSGNSITFAVTPGATAGSEVVTVTGNAISIQVETGVSTVDQCVTALQASAPSQALALATGSGATTVATAAALPLAGGIDGVAGSSFQGLASVSQTGVGEFTLTFSDAYPAVQSVQCRLLSATPQDLVCQIKSVDVVTAKTLVVRTLATATATDPTSACTLYVAMLLRNSSIAY